MFALVEALVTSVPSSLTICRRSLMGLGVVEMKHWGLSPSRRPIVRLSQHSCALFHFASSSHHAL